MLINNPFDENSPRSYRFSSALNHMDICVREIGYNLAPKNLTQTLQRNVYILHYIVAGKGEFNGQKFDASCGYVVVPGELEVITSDKNEPYETYWIMFKGPKAEELLELCGLPNHNCVFKFEKNDECIEIIRKYLFDFYPENEFEESCALQHVFYKLMSIHMKNTKTIMQSPPTLAQNIKHFMDLNYTHISGINELAMQNCYSRSYIYKVFKKEYGISPMEYLMKVRIDVAMSLLSDKNNNLSIGEIAVASGFSDPLNFSRFFRKKTGLSPQKYRLKKLKKIDE